MIEDVDPPSDVEIEPDPPAPACSTYGTSVARPSDEAGVAVGGGDKAAASRTGTERRTAEADAAATEPGLVDQKAR